MKRVFNYLSSILLTNVSLSKTHINFKQTCELAEFLLALKKFDESPYFLRELLNRVALCSSLVPSFKI